MRQTPAHCFDFCRQRFKQEMLRLVVVNQVLDQLQRQVVFRFLFSPDISGIDLTTCINADIMPSTVAASRGC